jgi:hypothetical protein
MKNSTEIKQAKRNLYLTLILANVEDLTDNEVDIMSLLAKDKDIQSALEKNKETK